MPARALPIPGRRGPGAATCPSASRTAISSSAAGGAVHLHRRQLRVALRDPGQSGQTRLDHEFRRAAGHDHPDAGAACRRQAAAQGQWLRDRAQLTAGPTRRPASALNDFRKRMHFAADRRQCRTVRGLESEARKTVAPAGYTVCNDGRDALMVALGQMDGGKTGVTRLVDGDAGRLRPRHHHAAGQRRHLSVWPSTRAAARRGGGQQRFCVTATAFEIQGTQNCASARLCAKRGFAAHADQGPERLCRPYRRDGRSAASLRQHGECRNSRDASASLPWSAESRCRRAPAAGRGRAASS